MCGHDWSISGDIDRGSVLDWRSRCLQPLFMDILNPDQFATSKENFRVIKKMTSRGTIVKYLRFDNAGEYQSKLQKLYKREKIMLDYTKPHPPQLNGVIARRFDIIK